MKFRVIRVQIKLDITILFNLKSSPNNIRIREYVGAIYDSYLAIESIDEPPKV